MHVQFFSLMICFASDHVLFGDITVPCCFMVVSFAFDCGLFRDGFQAHQMTISVPELGNTSQPRRIHQSVRPSVFLSIRPSVRPSVLPSVHLSVRPSIHFIPSVQAQSRAPQSSATFAKLHVVCKFASSSSNTRWLVCSV